MMTNRTSFARSRKQQFYPKADLELGDDQLFGMKNWDHQISMPDARAALESLGVSVSSLQSLATGTFHELFLCVQADGKHWVLKANRASDLVVDLALEIESQVSGALLTHGVTHAAITAVDCSRRVVNFDFQLMEYLSGASFRSFDDDELAVEQNLPHLARYLRHYHEIDGTGFGLLSISSDPRSPLVGMHETWADYLEVQADRHIRMVEGAGMTSVRDSTRIRGALDDLAGAVSDVAPRLIHGDCGPQNAIVTSDGTIAMMDWEDAVLGDPLFEVALWATFNPRRRWNTFFANYFEGEWEPNSLFWMYFLRISLAKTVVRLRFNYKDVPGREPAFARIHHALDALARL